jgi:ABC-type antimicrobial peptide transport system permease subunit
MQERLYRSIGPVNLVTATVSAFAMLAILLAVIGVSGAMGYRVSLRRREFGIRMALGASRSSLFFGVLAEAAVLLGLGIACGTPVALWATRLVKWLLFGVGTHDPLVIGTGITVLAVSGAAATLVPALRAARSDAATILRAD